MMHDGLIAIAPYALLSVAAAVTAALFGVAVLLRIRQRFMLIGSAAMALLALWFAGIAVTAGPAPIVRRGDVAELLRWLAAVTAAVWLLWLAVYSWSLIHIERRQ